VVQLQLPGLSIVEENGIVQMDAMVRADLIDLMARILVVVFEAEGGNVDDRADVQSQDQAGAPGSQGHRLLTLTTGSLALSMNPCLRARGGRLSNPDSGRFGATFLTRPAKVGERRRGHLCGASPPVC
jgi:hypothetical protein